MEGHIVAATALAGTLACFTAYALARRAFATHATMPRAEQRVAAHASVCLLHNVALALVGAYTAPMRALLLDGDARWHELVPGFGPAACLSAGFFLYDLLSIRNWYGGLSPAMVAHHILAGACWLGSAWTGFAQPWIAYCLLTEASSVPLSTRTILSALGRKRSRLYAAASLLFLASFLTVRTLLIPALARTWLRHPPIGAAACGPTRTAQMMGWMSALPLLFNAFWSVGIAKKALAELKASRGGRAGAAAK